VGLKQSALFILILSWLLAGCATQPAATAQAPEAAPVVAKASTTQASLPVAGEAASYNPVDLNVFAAASLTEPFSEIGKLFEAAHPGVSVMFNFAGSQQLAQQINEGAPADVFASANNKQMNVAIAAGSVVSGSQQVFTKNRLVVVVPKDNPAGIEKLADLAKPGLKLVFAAREVPVGQYSQDFLDKASADHAFGSTYQADVLANVVSYEDNVKAVLAKVALGEADGGIVYSSDISGGDAGKVGRLDIPDALNVIATYPIALVKGTRNPDLGQAFIDFVLSPQGQAVLAKYNFIPIAP